MGGIVFVAAIILVYVFWRRRARLQKDGPETGARDILQSGVVPYEYHNPGQADQDGHPTTSEASRSYPMLQGTNSVPGVIPSSKERAATTQFDTPGFASASSASGSGPEGLGTTGFIPAVGLGHASAGPTLEYRGLQSEVDNLRRVVQELQTERFEAPPNYQDIQNQNVPPVPQSQSADSGTSEFGEREGGRDSDGGKPLRRRRTSL